MAGVKGAEEAKKDQKKRPKAKQAPAIEGAVFEINREMILRIIDGIV